MKVIRTNYERIGLRDQQQPDFLLFYSGFRRVVVGPVFLSLAAVAPGLL